MPTEIYLIFAALAAYLIGSIPFGLLLTRLAGLGDIRKVGSGNIGATNVLRTGNKGLAALTLILDAAKGAAVILLVPLLLMPCWHLFSGWHCQLNCETATFVLGGIAVIGHMFPVWLQFKGGKGVATFFGVVLVYAPYVGLGALGTWLLVAILTRRSSVAALTATFMVPVYLLILNFSQIYNPTYFVNPPYHEWHLEPLPPIVICAFLVVLIWYQHRSNIARILNGTEPKIGQKTS